MWMFFAGLALFFVLHFITATPALRRKLAASTGENAWKGLIALGSLAGVVLICFGAFLVFSVYALISLLAAGKRATFAPALKWDLIGLGVGLFVAVGIMHSHRLLFGVAVA